MSFLLHFNFYSIREVFISYFACSLIWYAMCKTIFSKQLTVGEMLCMCVFIRYEISTQSSIQPFSVHKLLHSFLSIEMALSHTTTSRVLPLNFARFIRFECQFIYTFVRVILFRISYICDFLIIKLTLIQLTSALTESSSHFTICNIASHI